MTQENLSREVKNSEILEILESQKLAPHQVSDEYAVKHEFVGVKKIRKKLRELTESGELEKETMGTFSEPFYTVDTT